MEPNSEEQIENPRTLSTVEKSMRIGAEILKFVVIALAVVLPVRIFVAQPFVVSGVSMEPTIHYGDYLVIDKLSYRFSEPRRGDVLVFKYPLDTSIAFVKRVIGLPGETIRLSGGAIEIISTSTESYILPEPYLVLESDETSRMFRDEVTLGEDEYFMMGDNRLHSSDSREWGPLKKRYIVGRALARLYPISGITIFPGAHTFQIQ